MSALSTFKVPLPRVTLFELQVINPGILLVTINRTQRMNALPMLGHHVGSAIWNWLDDEPSMRVAVITGKGSKMFCAGADLLEQCDARQGEQRSQGVPEGGFAGLSQRRGKKPVIAAVNGLALGGGFEIDMVVTSPNAEFPLPEVLRGLYAGAGGLARVVRNCGMQIGSELALTGRRLTAQEAKAFNLVNRISASHESVLEEALSLAKQIASMPPNAIIVTRSGLREAWEAAKILRIGLEAFAAKKQPQWVDSKL
ncbi:ClpP/crotonase [Aspergillus tetrazonus]